MSQSSVRSNNSDTKSLTKTTSAQGGLHQKRNSNQKLEPISQPTVTKNVENKQQNLAQTTSTQQPAQTKTQYTAGLADSDYQAGTVSKIKTVSEDIKKAYLTNPGVAIDNEAEYYEIVRRLDECGHCWAGQQKYCTAPFKTKQKGPTTSLYQKDYVKHPLEGKGPKVNNDFYGTFNTDEPMDLGTTMRNDYKNWNQPAPKRAGVENKNSATGVPFAGRAGYKADYINWGNLPVTIERPPNNVTVIPELPCSDKTSYRDAFNSLIPVDQAKPLDRDLLKHKRSPLSPGIPFQGATTHNATYKPFKVGANPAFAMADEYEPTEAYPNQYKSTYHQDFNTKPKWKCPARIFMEEHPHPKTKYTQ
jgi:hypothetical protein